MVVLDVDNKIWRVSASNLDQGSHKHWLNMIDSNGDPNIDLSWCWLSSGAAPCLVDTEKNLNLYGFDFSQMYSILLINKLHLI